MFYRQCVIVTYFVVTLIATVTTQHQYISTNQYLLNHWIKQSTKKQKNKTRIEKLKTFFPSCFCVIFLCWKINSHDYGPFIGFDFKGWEKKIIGFLLTRCDLNRVGNANETSLQSVTITTGGAIIFRMDFKLTKAVTETTIINEAGRKSRSKIEDKSCLCCCNFVCDETNENCIKLFKIYVNVDRVHKCTHRKNNNNNKKNR